MHAVLTGGSAAAVYAPNAYMSFDADFVVRDDETLEALARALAPTGYRRDGRSRLFVHARSSFTVDFPKGPLAVGGDYVRSTSELERKGLRLRILTRTDCVRDRLAHPHHWNDYTALAAAVAVAKTQPEAIDMPALHRWTERESPELLSKPAEFRRRVEAA